MDKNELLIDVREKLTTFSEFYSDQYNQLAEDLAFRSGDQWEEDMVKARDEDSRPHYVCNITDAYANRIVAPVKKNPVGMKAIVDDEKLQELITARLHAIENESVASDAYSQGYDNAVTGGRGFWVVSKDYKGDTFDMDLSIDLVLDPTNCGLDPASISPNGSDAEWGFWAKPVDKKRSVEEYGEEINSSGDSLTLYGSKLFQTPEDTVYDLVFYQKEYTNKTIYQNELGETVDEKPEGNFKKRTIRETKVVVYHFIGDLEIKEDRTELNISQIPIVPCLGPVDYEKGLKIGRRGIVKGLQDIQMGRNFLFTNELEEASTAPKAKWLMANGQQEGHEFGWNTANTSSKPYLLHNLRDVNGEIAPQPTRIDTNPNLGPMIGAQDALDSVASRITGIFDPMLGGAEGLNQSGYSKALSIKEGELSTIQYFSNHLSSIKQTTSIVLDFLFNDLGNQKYTFKTDDGKSEVIEMDFSELGISLDDIEVSTDAGPMYANEKEMALIALESYSMTNPQSAPILADIVMDLQDFEGSSEASRRLKKMIPPEILSDEEAEDPEVVQVLETLKGELMEARQMLEQHNNISEEREAIFVNQIQTLENKLIAKETEAKNKIVVETIKQTSETERNTQDNMTEIAVAQIREGQAVDSEVIKQESAIQQKELEVLGSAIETQNPQEKEVELPLPVQSGINANEGLNPTISEKE